MTTHPIPTAEVLEELERAFKEVEPAMPIDAAGVDTIIVLRATALQLLAAARLAQELIAILGDDPVERAIGFTEARLTNHAKRLLGLVTKMQEWASRAKARRKT